MRGAFFALAALFLALSLPAEDLTVVSKITFGNTDTISTQYITSDYSRSSSRDSDSITHFPAER